MSSLGKNAIPGDVSSYIIAIRLIHESGNVLNLIMVGEDNMFPI